MIVKLAHYPVAELIYYEDHDKRYAHLSESDRKEFPDALKWRGGSVTPRVKTIAQLFKEVNKNGRRKYDFIRIWFHAVDVPISRAMKYAEQV